MHNEMILVESMCKMFLYKSYSKNCNEFTKVLYLNIHFIHDNPNAPRKELNKKLTKTQSPPTPPPLISTKKEQYISDLLKRNTPPIPSTVKDVAADDGADNRIYLGYERWLPTPRKVVKPRSVLNAATLAYIGDCIYELYARRHFLFPALGIEEYNVRVTAVVRCEAQIGASKRLEVYDCNRFGGCHR